MPCVDGCDELSCLPVDLVVLDVGVLHNGFTNFLCGRVLGVPSATLTRGPVDFNSVAGIWFNLMGVEKSFKLVQGRSGINACLLEDALEFM